MRKDLKVRENNADILGKNIPGRGISRYRGSEVGVPLAYLSSRKEASEAGVECVTVREIIWGLDWLRQGHGFFWL